MRQCVVCEKNMVEVKKFMEIHKKKYPVHLVCDYNVKKKILDEEKKVQKIKLGRPNKNEKKKQD